MKLARITTMAVLALTVLAIPTTAHGSRGCSVRTVEWTWDGTWTGNARTVGASCAGVGISGISWTGTADTCAEVRLHTTTGPTAWKSTCGGYLSLARVRGSVFPEVRHADPSLRDEVHAPSGSLHS